MNILITGGAGFIGRSLQEEMCKLNYKVVLLDKKDAFLLDDKSVVYVKADVCDETIMTSVFAKYKFAGIVHLAAVSRVVEAENNPAECKRTNVGGAKSLLSALAKSGQKPWLIFGSSREVYGEATSLPVKESAPKIAINIYGETKIKCEQLFLEFAKKHKLNTAIIRFSNVYGNKNDIFGRVIPRFIRAIYMQKTLTIEGGEQLIDFTYINDSVKGVIRIIDYLNQNNNTYDDFHLCPGVGWSLYQLIEIIEKTIGTKAKINIKPKRNYDVIKFVGNTEKIDKLLNLPKFTSLQKGIEQSINEYCYDLQTP